MPTRLAACEACRKAKLACDHKRPACTRCMSNDKAGICIYRVLPFKRKAASPPPSRSRSSIPSTPAALSSTLGPRLNPYPNPGYLGSSSHATIFDHISNDENGMNKVQDVSDPTSYILSASECADDTLLLQAANALKKLLNEFPLIAMKELVTFLVTRGANLALAEPFIEAITESVGDLFTSFSQDENWHLSCAKHLLNNSTRPFQITASTSFSEFLDQFVGSNFKLEALGIFFIAVSRATVEIPIFPPLYVNEARLVALRRLCTKVSDYILDNCVSLDCLNDLQLVLQYENMIMHLYVDGDHSYHSWRKLGDVISSISALGYHDDIDNKPDTPVFLTQLRKTAVARIYSADKNIAIFLGRPPRMTKRFSHFQIPSSSSDPSHDPELWDPSTRASYRAETRWSALCASLKEKILEIAQEKNKNTNSERISAIQAMAEAQWDALPPHFKLEGSFQLFDQKSPFERDFLISTRLNYLHVLFLLRLLFLSTPAEPDAAIFAIAGDMLTLVTEAILIRDQVVNSGTSLKWKIAHYGLPAAGIVLLAMLKQHNTPNLSGVSRSKNLQDLSIFVSEIQRGSIVRKGDPLFVLLSRATQTIQKLLESFYSEIDRASSDKIAVNEQSFDDWATVLGQDIWDFEAGFWQNLAFDPSLELPDSSEARFQT